MNQLNRRRFLASAARAGSVGLGGAAAVVGFAQERPQDRGGAAAEANLITAEAQAAIDRGLAFLASNQFADGSFGDSRMGGGPGNVAVAVAALAGLALMAGGHQPGRGRYGQAVLKAADYVVARGAATPSTPGYLVGGPFLDHTSIYQHGFGALFLSEVYGMVPDKPRQDRLRTMLEKAIGYTRAAQNGEGGWRYKPRETPGDVSVTVAQLMALRAARNAGVAVPKGVVDKCVAYIKACQLPDGGFNYARGNVSDFPRSAAAVVGLFSAGVYEGREIERGLRYLSTYRPGRLAAFADHRGEARHYFYGHYYAALAMWTAGGGYWAEWFPAIRDALLANVRGNAAWSDNALGGVYATAMACIILQLPNNYLPIMQK